MHIINIKRDIPFVIQGEVAMVVVYIRDNLSRNCMRVR